MPGRVHDVIGIGIGPFNLGLACLLDPVAEVDSLFFERAPEFNWHGGTLLDDATLQTPFLCDLVTLADPTSRFSFTNYMKESGQIYSFYAFLLDTENFFLPRKAFNGYYRWAASQLGNLRFSTEVVGITHDAAAGVYVVETCHAGSGQHQRHRARRLVLGGGMAPLIPSACQDAAGHAVHAAHYLAHRERLKTKSEITVIGSGQSAAEIVHDLLTDIDRHGYRLTWVTRSPRLIPRELTKQTLQMTSPDYADYFFSLSVERRAELIDMLKAVYQGINPSLINAIFDLRYRKMLSGDVRFELVANSQVTDCRYDAASGRFALRFAQPDTGVSFARTADAVVLGTGYHWPRRTILDGIAERINWTGDGHRYAVARNCSIDRSGAEIFVNNAEIHPHAFIPPDLGQACYRNSIIIRELTGRDVYPIESSTAFQTFRPDRRPEAGRPDAAADAAALALAEEARAYDPAV